GRRVNIGGEIQGAYVQFAAKAFQNTFPTVIRLNGEQTTFKRILSSNISFSNAASGDTRNGANLHYLLLTNQTGATNPITGATYTSGAIDGGQLNWGNVDSYQGWQASEIVVDDFATISANTKWSSWLSTQASAGYNDYRSDRVSLGSFSLYAPTASGNGVAGKWALGGIPSDSYQPARTKAVRFSALASNNLFHDRVHSDTILGADFTRTDLAQIAYSYFQADANFNAIVTGTPIPGVTANGGRTALTKQFWSIDDGPMIYPLFSPRASQVTINGVNFVRQLSNPPNASIASPSNPHGVILGGANYIITKYLNRGIFGVNNMHWFDGKLETLAGFRAVDILEDRLEQGSAPPAPPTTDKKAVFRSVSYNAGVNYALLSWLRPYVAFSDSFDPPIVQQVDPLGNVATTAHGLGGEAGLKFNNASNTVSGSLSIYSVKSKNEEILISSTIQNDINPNGLNGRYGASNQWVNVDRKSSGAELNITAAPTPNWRMRFGAATIDGTIESTKAYKQVYNDQFYADASGTVTYADGTPVWVKSTSFSSSAPTVAAGTSGAQPLTIAMMNDRNSLYWANPVAVSGAITSSSNVATVLKSVDPVHGAILTGRTGLPISAIQIDPTTAGGALPPGTIVAAQAGDKTAGYYRYSANTTQTYTFSRGPLKGFRIGGSLLFGWNNRNYYYYPKAIVPGAPRQLFAQPHLFRFDLITGYERKFKRVTWSTQLNVTNLFNRYHIYITPNSTTGYTSINGLNATFDQQPRAYSWTNSIRF
ncbi:MAG TPA: TonB-dependent receptor, partial [Nitrolancea sp.]|nr:TonB-dependent receptor [Nitrolancea sp.]